jgi:RsiW-degrading membrane proteinase PrsW (M82 family)
MNSSFNTIAFSLAGGILPALLWLWFWLKEDAKQPEPKYKIAISFLCGMLAVWPAIELEKYFCQIFEPDVCTSGINPGFFLLIIWAATEEIIKYIFAFVSSFWKNKYLNEPLDPIIYMITVALGFSALENALFLFNAIDVGILSKSIIAGNSRFLGATLLHTASSATVGVMMGLAFFKKLRTKRLFLFTGVILAILLHTIFNLLIIKFESDLFFIFAGVWLLIIILFVFIEKIKKINY